MALFPCDDGGHRYTGRQQTIYPAVVHGVRSARAKRRLCPAHFDDAMKQIISHAYDGQLDFDQADVLRCGVCDESASLSAAMLFVTVYKLGSDREDYWAPLHEGCIADALRDWGLPATMI
jgi:hypothetical protein